MSQNKYDCILIPGGGLLEDGSLPGWTAARLERALEIQHLTDWMITLSGGTVHKPPPLDQEGYPVYESRKAAEFLVSSGMEPGRVLAEISSYDTIGNAYFARTLFTDPLGLARCHIITSDFHLPRAEAAFRWVYSLAPVPHRYQLSFEGVAERGLAPAALTARQEREKASLANLFQTIQHIGSLALFQRWLYTEHAAYAVGGRRERLSEEELKTY